MPQMGTSITSGALGAHGADEITARRPLTIYSCSRLGRLANPPGFSIADWFRAARRR
jgi:hypothetical protein